MAGTTSTIAVDGVYEDVVSELQMAEGVSAELAVFPAFADFTNRGRVRFTVNASPNIVIPSSQVVASITEITSSGVPILGLAPMEIFNVVPESGRIIVLCHVHWEQPLRTRVNFLISR
jgi:hypothetical protein